MVSQESTDTLYNIIYMFYFILPVAIRNLYDNSGNITCEHANRYDGQHVSKNCGDKK